MNRAEAIQAFTELRDDRLVIVGPGSSSGSLYWARHEPATIYNMELGYPTAICLGLALAAPEQRVVALEGDGSMVAGIGVFTTIARYRPANLLVLVLDNGRYATTGDGTVETATGTGTDLAAVAVACGLEPAQVLRVDDPVALQEALRASLERPGPWVVIARVEPPTDAERRMPKRIPELDLVETAVGFRWEMRRRGYG
jgi:sulfopyruvate decarboxylase subunit beta